MKGIILLDSQNQIPAKSRKFRENPDSQDFLPAKFFDNKVINQYVKSDKMVCIIYADIESLIRKIERCANNPENFSTSKIRDHIPCGYSMLTIWVFDHIEKKHTLYHGKDCMETFCTCLREQPKNIIDFEKKILLLTKGKSRSHHDANICYICGKRFIKEFANNKNY